MEEVNIITSEKQLFTKSITSKEAHELLKLSPELFVSFIANCGSLALDNYRNDEAGIRLLKANYQKIISLVLSSQISSLVNNLALHFILISSHLLIAQEQKIYEAKQLLKKSWDYIGAAHVDPLLLSCALNNLALVQLKRSKFYKSLAASTKGVEIMESRVRELKVRKEKKQLVEDVVVMIALLRSAKQSLGKIMKINKNHFYKQLATVINYMGYRYSLKYLGKQSKLTLFFDPVHEHLKLPIFKMHEPEQKKLQNLQQQLIIRHLQNIYEVLKSKKDSDIILVNNSSIQEHEHKISSINHTHSENYLQINQSSLRNRVHQSGNIPQPIVSNHPLKHHLPDISVKPPLKVPDISLQIYSNNSLPSHLERGQNEVISSQFIKIEQQLIAPEAFQNVKVEDSLAIAIEIKKDAVQQIVGNVEAEEEAQVQTIISQKSVINHWDVVFEIIKNQYNQVGTLSVNVSQKKKKKSNEIGEEKILLILPLINLQDKLPYQCLNDKLAGEELLNSIAPFISIDSEGELLIYSRCIGIMDPLNLKFIGQECLVFINHIRQNAFRVALAPIYTASTIYLNLQLHPETLKELFQFTEDQNVILSQLYRNINYSMEDHQIKIKLKSKINKIKDAEFFRNRVCQILRNFASFLSLRQDQTSINQVLENNLCYYKYLELEPATKGTFYFARYLPSVNGLDIFMQNDFYTHSLDGLTKAQGNALYKSSDFRQNFGIPMNFSKRKMLSFIEIIVKKYRLTVFTKPLTEHDLDRYMENAIEEVGIHENSFAMRHFMSIDHYFYPITISILSVNSQIPIGIKVQSFKTITATTDAYFIHIVPEEWLRPIKKIKDRVPSIFVKAVDEYEYNRNYFITDWMDSVGYEHLFQKVAVHNNQFNLESNRFQFLKSKALFQLAKQDKQNE